MLTQDILSFFMLVQICCLIPLGPWDGGLWLSFKHQLLGQGVIIVWPRINLGKAKYMNINVDWIVFSVTQFLLSQELSAQLEENKLLNQY